MITLTFRNFRNLGSNKLDDKLMVTHVGHDLRLSQNPFEFFHFHRALERLDCHRLGIENSTMDNPEFTASQLLSQN